MSLQAIINQHAEAMVARHNQVENLIKDQAATQAREINEKTKADDSDERDKSSEDTK